MPDITWLGLWGVFALIAAVFVLGAVVLHGIHRRYPDR